jgi:hypothetical protein
VAAILVLTLGVAAAAAGDRPLQKVQVNAATTGEGRPATSSPAQRAAREQGSAASGSLELLSAPSGAEVNHNVNAELGSQAETAIALEPDNPSRVIAAIGPVSGNPKAWISDDGMTPGSQVERQLPSSSLLAGGGGVPTTLSLCCQPTATADLAGNLWYAVRTTGSSSHIAINRVAAGGTAFQASNVAIPRDSTDLQQQPRIAIDNGASAKTGRLYAVWIENDGATQDVVISECDATLGGGGDPASHCDDPDNWSSPTTITDAGGSDAFASPDIGIAPNGDVYVVWWHRGDPGASGANQIEIDRCAVGTDCTIGASWGADAAVRDLDVEAGGLPGACPIIGAPGGRVGPQPYVEAGPAGTVYVAFSDLRDNAAPSSPTRCTATGTDKTWDSYIVAGGAVNTAPTTAETPVRLSDDGATDLNDHFLPALSVDPSTGNVEASLYSTKHDPSGQRTHQYHVISTDLGISYSGMTQFSSLDSRFSGSLSTGVDYGSYAGADSAGGTFVPSWTDNRFIQGRKGDLYVLSPQIETTIDSSPTGTVKTASNSFTFSAPVTGFQCATDSGLFGACSPPTQVGPLTNGSHTFLVRATDAVGNPVDLSPASATWTINDTRAPQTKITKRPDNKTKKKNARHKFTADEVGATFECRYNRNKWKTCESPRKKKVDPGKHRFKVRAVDVGENTDSKPAKDTWRFMRNCAKKDAGKQRQRCRSKDQEKHF